MTARCCDEHVGKRRHLVGDSGLCRPSLGRTGFTGMCRRLPPCSARRALYRPGKDARSAARCFSLRPATVLLGLTRQTSMIVAALIGPNLGAARSKVMTLAVSKKSGGSPSTSERVTAPSAQIRLELCPRAAHAIGLRQGGHPLFESAGGSCDLLRRHRHCRPSIGAEVSPWQCEGGEGRWAEPHTAAVPGRSDFQAATASGPPAPPRIARFASRETP